MGFAEDYPNSQIDRQVWFTEQGNRSVFGGAYFDHHRSVLSDDIYLVQVSELRVALALADAARSIEPPLDVRVTVSVRPTGVIRSIPEKYSDVLSDFPDDTNERLAQWLDENH